MKFLVCISVNLLFAAVSSNELMETNYQNSTTDECTNDFIALQVQTLPTISHNIHPETANMDAFLQYQSAGMGDNNILFVALGSCLVILVQLLAAKAAVATIIICNQGKQHQHVL